MHRIPLIVAPLVLLTGCAQHLFTVAEPNPTGPSYRVSSTTTLFGARESVRRAEHCDTNLIDKVIVHQNIGQALLTVVTLGAVFPIEIEYQCAKKPGVIAGPGE